MDQCGGCQRHADPATFGPAQGTLDLNFGIDRCMSHSTDGCGLFLSVFIGQAEQKSKQIDRLINSPATSVPPLQVVHRVLFFSSVYLRLFWFARQWQQENVGEVLATGMSDMRRAILSWPRATILPIDGFLPATATPLPPPPSGEKEKVCGHTAGGEEHESSTPLSHGS